MERVGSFCDNSGGDFLRKGRRLSRGGLAMSAREEAIGDALMIGSIFIFVVMLAVIAWWFSERGACVQRAKGLGAQYSWGPNQGCLVKQGRVFVPLENLRVLR